MAKKVADQLVDTLEKAGVRRIYAVTGDSLNEVNEAVRKNGRLRWIHVRHEETGAYAAAAEAQLTGELACCAGSSGPGHVHLINGLYDAQRSGAPVLAIASTIPSREFGTEYFQETNTIKLFVGVIGLPGDLAAENATAGLSSTFSFPTRQRVCPAEQEIRELADLLNNAKKVTLYCGIGAKDAHSELVQEAFIKIINMGDMVYAATIRNLAFTTVQNLLIDRLRRRVVVSEVHSYIYDIQPEFTEETESAIHANSLLQAEYAWTKTLPEACRKVYCMNRFEELTAEEISKELHISRRTVEAQIQKGRRRVRPYLKAVGGF